MKAAMLMAPLLLQQPKGKPSYKNNSRHLEKRLTFWHQGRLTELLTESETIQSQLVTSTKALDDGALAKKFATMVFNNNFKGALQC